jgi:hypothetical protein
MRKLGAVVAAFLLCGGVAAAGQADPPAEYDHWHPALIIEEQDYFDIDPICRGRFPRSNFPPVTGSQRIMGCADIGDGISPCRIVVPVAGGIISHEKRELIIRHERAHCNGWPAHHPRSDSGWPRVVGASAQSG